jgi:hypothetical protein
MPEVLREGGRPKRLLTLVREAIRRRHMCPAALRRVM